MSTALSLLRRHRGMVALGVAVLATVIVLSVVTARGSGRADDLDPQNPSAAGAQAVARVLAQHGVQVSVVRRAAELDRATVDADTTVLVTSSENLGRRTAQRVELRTVPAGVLVLAAPGPTLIRALGLPVSVHPARVAAPTSAGCDDPLLGDLAVDVGPTEGYRGSNGFVTTCFQERGKRPASLVARVDRGTPTYAVGGAALFTNGRIDRADNAAAALRLLGQHERLVWYVPDIRDVTAGDSGSLATQLPGGLFPALGLVAAAVLATMVWRGRRLGPLVVEPLPVMVKAVESTQGRGRLYRRVRDRTHAAAILRDATARRLTTHLRLPSGTDPHRLAAAVAETTGTDPRTAYDALVARPVPDDTALIRLASELAALEKEVHRA